MASIVLAHCFKHIDYLGAEDSSYVRAATRKPFVAAVARIYHPGTKFDNVPILDGPQGIGKSTLYYNLGGDYFSDSLSLTDMKDKAGAEKLQGFWILELGELAGMKKVDVETVKSFISRTDDDYRPSYGKVVESHPRQCIIVGSTNSETGFLRDITGNRRFWPIHVTGNSVKKSWDMTRQDIDQLWAEAKYLYEHGEKLFLESGDTEGAEFAQRDAMETDERKAWWRSIWMPCCRRIGTQWTCLQGGTSCMARSSAAAPTPALCAAPASPIWKSGASALGGRSPI